MFTQATLSKPKTNPVLLTDAAIRRYKQTNERREIPDAGGRGLRLIIQAKTGAKSFALRFRKPDGTHAKLTLGPYDATGKEIEGQPVIGQPLTLAAARALAASVNRERAMGVDVAKQRRAAKSRHAIAAAHPGASAFGAALIEFFSDHTTKKGSRPRRWREDASALGLRFGPDADASTDGPEITRGGLADARRDKDITTIDGHDVFAVVDAARKLNIGKARRQFAALSSFFGWAIKRRRVPINPCAGVYKPPPPPARERTLNDDELAVFWMACNEVGAPFGAVFQIMLLSGCRLREASDMARNELEDHAWTIPGTRTKNGRSLTLTLPRAALQIIDSVPKISNGFVFSSNGSTPVSGFSRAKGQLDKEMTRIAGKPVAPWRLHDLRRTAASGMAKIGIQLPIIEKILNHVSGSFAGIVSVYQKHEFTLEKADALHRWAVHVQSLVDEKVVAAQSRNADA
jgi:integrase